MTTFSRDSWLLLTAKTLRTIGYGLLTVIFSLYLHEAGFPPTMVGLMITLTLIGSALLMTIFATWADRLGRRRMLIFGSVLMIISGVIFAWTNNPWFLAVATLTGTLKPQSGETGPFESIEAAILPQTVPVDRRNQIFARYYATGSIAFSLGALVAGMSTSLQSVFQVDLLTSYRMMITLYAGLGAVSVFVLAALSSNVELVDSPTSGKGFVLHKSRGPIVKLAGLFALDSLGGGFVAQSLIVYWLSVRFGAGTELLGPVYFAINLINSLCYFLSEHASNRFGLINTMVFTHLPSNIFLVLLPLMPTLPLAIACLLSLNALSNWDVPTRASYIVAVVDPDERTAATALTMMVRTLTQAVGPVLAGLALQFAYIGTPFFLGGGMKIIYDLVLYRNFKDLKPADELNMTI